MHGWLIDEPELEPFIMTMSSRRQRKLFYAKAREPRYVGGGEGSERVADGIGIEDGIRDLYSRTTFHISIVKD